MSQSAVSTRRSTQLSAAPDYRVRFVTAASLFDGHDASINIMRRILQASGVEVIHLGHNRSVREIVDTAVEEDAQGIAVSSYQGGHTEFFKYMIDMLRESGRPDIQVFGGGGGVIVSAEITELHEYGVCRIYSPQDGQQMGLQGMIDDMIEQADFYPGAGALDQVEEIGNARPADLARLITALENGTAAQSLIQAIKSGAPAAARPVPVLGITGTGGSGKSSLTDELILRARLDFGGQLKIAVIAIDPSRRKTGGALLGDRIRMNAIDGDQVFMRSLATRDSGSELPKYLSEIIAAVKLAGYGLVLVETPGIGQGDSAIVPLVDRSLYVMTPEFGAASQLEKIDMLDYADLVAINKFDRKGAQDALRDARKQIQRNRQNFATDPNALPVFATMASNFNDPGVTALYHQLCDLLEPCGLPRRIQSQEKTPPTGPEQRGILPAARQRYLSEVADSVRAYKQSACAESRIARECQQLRASARMLEEQGLDSQSLTSLADTHDAKLSEGARSVLVGYPQLRERYSGESLSYTVRNREVSQPLAYTSLSGTRLSRVSLPRFSDDGDLLQWLMLENVPGEFPYTAGVFPFKREGEDPTRMFAGEGDAFRTNQRFHYLSKDASAKRLSTAFDSVTLYGADPAERPDIYGKVGTSGVSIATLDDMKTLYAGFDLCSPQTSVSMTINGPAPTVLAFFLNTAIDQQIERFREENGREPDSSEHGSLRAYALENVRGTVQADILKEDQGQNTCLFSTDFSLRMMGDIQQYFIAHNVRNFYSVSISGYHIAEAGANPITQLALTMANGFTYVEAYLARGMNIDDFVPNFSFFFSNGMDPEYTVMGRVARRIWAVAMRDYYGAGARSQKLKYHIQTSGRSLHAQEMSFNDIRTTLQALIAVYDNCNSLHTNAHDEAVTTPGESSVRRALAIQMVINREWGLARNENPNQGSFVIDELTELVEEAVLAEFDRITERGGVLGAMETGYQRGKIQEESLYYEQRKHDGSHPIVGVNTFLGDETEAQGVVELARGTEAEKQGQLKRLSEFQAMHVNVTENALQAVQRAALTGENVFAELMNAVRVCSLGQITETLFEVGGKYRRNM